jgi:hypothetical protein
MTRRAVFLGALLGVRLGVLFVAARGGRWTVGFVSMEGAR